MTEQQEKAAKISLSGQPIASFVPGPRSSDIPMPTQRGKENTGEKAIHGGKEGLKNAGESLSDTAQQAKEKTSGATQQAKEKGSDYMQYGKEKMGQMGQSASDTAQQAKEKALGAYDVTKEGLQQASQSASDTSEHAQEKARSILDSARKMSSDYAGKGYETAIHAKDYAAQTAYAGKERAENLVKGAASTVGGVVHSVEDMMHRAAETVVDTSSSALRMTKEAVGFGQHSTQPSMDTNDKTKITSQPATHRVEVTVPTSAATKHQVEKSLTEQ